MYHVQALQCGTIARFEGPLEEKGLVSIFPVFWRGVQSLEALDSSASCCRAQRLEDHWIWRDGFLGSRDPRKRDPGFGKKRPPFV